MWESCAHDWMETGVIHVSHPWSCLNVFQSGKQSLRFAWVCSCLRFTLDHPLAIAYIFQLRREVWEHGTELDGPGFDSTVSAWQISCVVIKILRHHTSQIQSQAAQILVADHRPHNFHQKFNFTLLMPCAGSYVQSSQHHPAGSSQKLGGAAGNQRGWKWKGGEISTWGLTSSYEMKSRREPTSSSVGWHLSRCSLIPAI